MMKKSTNQTDKQGDRTRLVLLSISVYSEKGIKSQIQTYLARETKTNYLFDLESPVGNTTFLPYFRRFDKNDLLVIQQSFRADIDQLNYYIVCKEDAVEAARKMLRDKIEEVIRNFVSKASLMLNHWREYEKNAPLSNPLRKMDWTKKERPGKDLTLML